MSNILSDFKKFLLQGNLITLAIAFVMGLVFAALVKAFITDLVLPIIGAIIGKPDFSTLSFSINSSQFFYGDFINAVIVFVSTAAAVLFFVVQPYNAYTARRPADAETKDCPECTSEIPVKAKRCPQCTAVLTV